MIEEDSQLLKTILNKCIYDIDTGKYKTLGDYDAIAWRFTLPVSVLNMLTVAVYQCDSCGNLRVDLPCCITPTNEN